MEFIVISLILLVGMSTVDIPENREASEDDLDAEQKRPYGVHG